jgi:predicted nucleic acid-binding protein
VKLVIDASVAVKWLLRDPAVERDTDRAAALLGAVAHGSVRAIEPAHWVSEVLGVVSRIKPDHATATVALLTHARFTTVSSRAIYRRAAEIAIMLNHHLFDTLYHAVALEEGATLVTADEAYFAKAKDLGAIVPLAEFTA